MNPYEQGITYYQEAKYKRALASFTEAINQNHQPLESAYNERSKCYEALGKLDEAKADLAYILTLSIDDTQRKQITDLMALLDYTYPPALPEPSDLPVGLQLDETSTELTMWVEGIKLTLNAHTLKVTQPPGLFSSGSSIEVPLSEISQVVCQRELKKRRSILASYILLTDRQVELIKLTHYEQIRYIQWELRQYLNLPDTVQRDEYVPLKPTVGYDVRGLRQWGGWEAGVIIVLLLVFAVPVFMMFTSMVYTYFNPRPFQYISDLLLGVPWGLVWLGMGLYFAFMFLYPRWYVQQMIDRGRITTAIITAKNYYTWRGQARHHVYNVHYRYYNYEATINSKEMFDTVKIGDEIEVHYLPDKPHLTKPYF